MKVEHEDQQEQTQQWFTKTVQERFDLSASVEEALEDRVVEAWHWQEMMEGGTGFLQGVRERSLIPPRLSLQSRMLPVPTSYPDQEPGEQMEKSQSGMIAHHTQSLRSFAQQLSATLAIYPEDAEDNQQVAKALTPGKMEPMPYIPATGAISQMGQSRQRLAGHTTRIRLEAITIPVTPTADLLSMPVVEQLETSALSGNESSMGECGLDVLQGSLSALARGALSGRGCFASGQGEVTVANPHVLETSLVFVTLTANPGPVAVHYITLQEHAGFTVHLTAPALQETRFNYIILLSELF